MVGLLFLAFIASIHFSGCCIAPGCVVNYPCTGCRQTGNVPCDADKSLFGTCVRGRFEIRACARGTYFDIEARECANANAGTAGNGPLVGGRTLVNGVYLRG